MNNMSVILALAVQYIVLFVPQGMEPGGRCEESRRSVLSPTQSEQL